MATTRANSVNEPPPGTLEQEQARFLRCCPDYEKTRPLDELRQAEYTRLDNQGHVYLDYTGGGLYGERQVQTHMDLLLNHVFGNPHSTNPTSRAITCLIEAARAYVLEFFNASPDEYVVHLHPERQRRAEAGGRVVPVRAGRALPADLRQPQLGQRHPRVCPRARGGQSPTCRSSRPSCASTPKSWPASWTRPAGGAQPVRLTRPSPTSPACSIRWSGSSARSDQGWDVLLDAAAFVPTNRLDLGAVHPDFVSLSFYKMFGYPTGVGACWRGTARWPNCTARGSRAARSRWPRCRATATSCTWARRVLRTAP